MVRKLVKTGNSVAVILSKDIRDHLGIGEYVDMQIVEGEVRLRKPLTVDEAAARSDEKFSEAYRNLAK
jgi:hypothetical protein